MESLLYRLRLLGPHVERTDPGADVPVCIALGHTE
jgi:hypothetical protein